MEWFVKIEGFEDYTVSTLGRVYSLKTDALLSQTKNHHGFLRVTLYADGVKKTATVHKLVAEAFAGPITEGYEIYHLDGDVFNNEFDNLACREAR